MSERSTSELRPAPVSYRLALFLVPASAPQVKFVLFNDATGTH